MKKSFRKGGSFSSRKRGSFRRKSNFIVVKRGGSHM